LATPTRVPVELYLHTEYEPAAEYVDGEIEERPMGENDHSAWQDAIAYWFRMHATEWSIRVRPELRVQTSATNFRIPDVAILDASLLQEPTATRPPLAVFEVLSPEDYHLRLMRKLADYERMGIQAIYVVDPQTGIFEQFVDGALKQQDSFALAKPGIAFPFSEIANLIW
jgi:Uma2 family endonuclease